MDKLFHLSENETNVRTEIVAGITTFMTMAYILAVNPNILSASGMDRGAVFTATALASMLASFLMAAFANYPFVLAPGMGLNAYFAYTVVLQMGYSWQMALAAVFVEGVIFIVLSLTNVREAIFNAIPLNLKAAVSTGIGLFIAFIGLQNAKIVVDSATLVSIYPIKASLENGMFRSEGITVLLAMLGHPHHLAHGDHLRAHRILRPGSGHRHLQRASGLLPGLRHPGHVPDLYETGFQQGLFTGIRHCGVCVPVCGHV